MSTKKYKLIWFQNKWSFNIWCYLIGFSAQRKNELSVFTTRLFCSQNLSNTNIIYNSLIKLRYRIIAEKHIFGCHYSMLKAIHFLGRHFIYWWGITQIFQMRCSWEGWSFSITPVHPYLEAGRRNPCSCPKLLYITITTWAESRLTTRGLSKVRVGGGGLGHPV